jgi:hypothetical protein
MERVGMLKFSATGAAARYVRDRRLGWWLLWRLFLPNTLGPFYSTEDEQCPSPAMTVELSRSPGADVTVDARVAKRLLRDAAEIEALRNALREADRLASVAHSAIWDVLGTTEVPRQIPRLHSNEDERSAQSAIWELHRTVRPLLAPTAEPNPQDPELLADTAEASA